jgi:hypothetical protein
MREAGIINQRVDAEPLTPPGYGRMDLRRNFVYSGYEPLLVYML